MLELATAAARSQRLHPGLPRGWERPAAFEPSSAASLNVQWQGAGTETRRDSIPGTRPKRQVDVLCHNTARRRILSKIIRVVLA